MSGFLTFVFSFIMVIISSYFVTTLIPVRRMANFCLFFVLTVMSQVIFTFEILSIIKEINPIGTIVFNLIFFILSLGIWINKGRKIVNPLSRVSIWAKRFVKALKKDKILTLLFVLFLLTSLYCLFITIIIPSNVGDVLSYHLARVGFWIQHQTMNHYFASVLRQTIFPINSEILILWSMVFIRSDYLAGFVEYISYICCLFTLFAFLSYLKISPARILWCIVVVASLPIFIIESSSYQINLLMGFLLFSSFYLYIFGVRENDKYSLTFSALALAIAVGTKSTVSFYIPVLGLVYLLISIRERKKEFYKPMVLFLIYFLATFILFGIYNYILNFIEFGAFMGPESIVREHSQGHTGFLANFMQYVFMFIDIHGLEYFFGGITDYITRILKYYHPNSTISYNSIFIIHENYSKFGILGIPIFILIFQSALLQFRIKNTRRFYLSTLGLIGLGYLITISMIKYDYWYGRFFATLCIFCAPLLLFLYHPKIKLCKVIIAIISGFYFIVIPMNNVSHPFLYVFKELQTANFNLKIFRNEVRLRNEYDFGERSELYYVLKYLVKIAPDHSKIAVVNSRTSPVYPFFEENKTWKIFPEIYPDILKRMNNYDCAVILGPNQVLYVLDENKVRYNYVSGKDGIYAKDSQIPFLSLYINEQQKIISSGKPMLQLNLIDPSQIKGNFKLHKIAGIENSYILLKKSDK